MDKEEIIDFIENRPWIRNKCRLDRMGELLKALGNPHKKLKYIHIAGSNGKGSASAMFTSILMVAGYKVGTFTSPHLIEYNERFCINNAPINDEDLSLIVQKIKDVRLSFVPGVFEILTAIAFVYFQMKKVDIVVLEVGLGGKYDATNIIEKSELSVLMNIGLEHTEILGNTLEEIASEKAGIIKRNGDVVAYDNKKEVSLVFKKVAKEKNANIKIVDFNSIEIINEGLNKQTFNYGKYKNVELGLLGKHQFYNASVVIEGIKILVKKGYNIDDSNIINGLKDVKWDARLSILNKKPLFILDGAHNPQCADALKISLPKILRNKKAIMIYGSLKDKNYLSIIEMMSPYAKEFICLTPNSSRALKASTLASIIKKKGIKACYCKNAYNAILKAFNKAKDNDVIIAFGSLYLAGEIKDAFNKIKEI